MQPEDENAGTLEISVEAELRGFASQLRRRVERAAKAVKPDVNVDADTTPFRVETKAAAEEVSRTTKAHINVDADTNPAKRAITTFLQGFSKNFGRLFAVIGATLAKSLVVGGIVAGLSLLATWLTVAAGQLLEFAGAIGPAWHALGLLPAALTSVIGLFATLAIGVKGVGDALKETFSAYATIAAGGQLSEAEVEKLNQALAKLAPSAREFVVEISKLAPAFTDLRLEVQQRLFEGLGQAVATLVASYLPGLQDRLGAIAYALNGGIRSALAYIDTVATKNALFTALEYTSIAVRNLTAGLGPLLQVFLDISEVGGGLMADITGGFGAWAQEVADAVRAAKDSGALAEWMQAGLDVLKQLGSILYDFGSGLVQIFDIANKAVGPGGALGSLKLISSTFNDWAHSKDGQEALYSFFVALRDVGQTLRPVLESVATAIGMGLAPAIKDIVEGLAPFAIQFFTYLGGALRVLAPLLGEFAGSFGNMLFNLLEVVVHLVAAALPGLTAVFNGLATGLNALIPAAGPVGKALGDLLTAAAPLLQILGQLAAVLLTELAVALRPLLAVLQPILEAFSEAASTVFAKWLGYIQQASSTYLPALTKIFTVLGEALAPVLPMLGQLATEVFGQLAAVGLKLQPILLAVLQRGVAQLMSYLPEFLKLLSTLSPILMEIAEMFGDAMVQAFQMLIPYLPALRDAAGQLLLAFVQLIQKLAPLIPTLAQLAIIVVLDLLPAFLDLLPTIVDLAKTLTELFIEAAPVLDQFIKFAIFLLDVAVKSGMLKGSLATLKLMIESAGGGLKLFLAIGQGAHDLFEAIGKVVRVTVGPAFAGVATVIGGLMRALGPLIEGFRTLGHNIVQGIINGLWDMASSLWNAGTSIINGLSWTVRHLLGIASPSKVFRDYGRQIGKGFTLGLQDSMAAVKDMAVDLADAATGPWNGVRAAGATQAGVTNNITLTGNEMTSEEQMEMLGSRIAWQLRAG